MKQKLIQALNWLRRYTSLTLLVCVAIVIFLLFFNDNSVVRTYQYERQIIQLRQEIQDNRDTLAHYTELNRRLNTDPQTMERIVREQYHMQRPGEDVYLFVNE